MHSFHLDLMRACWGKVRGVRVVLMGCQTIKPQKQLKENIFLNYNCKRISVSDCYLALGISLFASLSLWNTQHTHQVTDGSFLQLPRMQCLLDYLYTHMCNELYFWISSFLTVNMPKKDMSCSTVRSRKSLNHQSLQSALHLRVRGHSSVPFLSLKAQWSFGRVIWSRKKDATTIRCCCPCAIPLGSTATFECHNRFWGRGSSTGTSD